MRANFDYKTLVADFVVGDRRLGDRTDIVVSVDARTYRNVDAREYALSQRRLFEIPPQAPIAKSALALPTSRGTVVYDYSSPAPLSGNESERMFLLGLLIQFFESSGKDLRLYRTMPNIASRLKGCRQSLGVSQSELAAQVGTSRIALSMWELGAQAPGKDAMYRWCQSLGIFCPPRTVLVRVVDVSPELLLALKENPDELRRLSPDQFEAFIANRLDRMGYSVALTGPTTRKDGGIDIIAVPKAMNVGSVVLAAQVKHHLGEQRTGRDAVDRLAAWKGTPFGMGLLVTNTGFTKDAVWAATQEHNANFIRLRDFNDLKRWLEDQYGDPEDWREIPDRIELAPGVVIEIPKPRLYSATGDVLTDEN